MEKHIVVSVNHATERDKIISNIYNIYEIQNPEIYRVEQKSPNKVKVFYREDVHPSLQECICSYTIIIIPVLVNLDPIKSFSGLLEFRLDNTIKELKSLVKQLESLNGEQVIKENFNAPSLGELARLLY